MTTLQKFLTDIEAIHSKELKRQRQSENGVSNTSDTKSVFAVDKGAKPDTISTVEVEKEERNATVLGVDAEELTVIFLYYHSLSCTEKRFRVQHGKR